MTERQTAESDALRERLRKDAEASVARPSHEKRHMPAIRAALSDACANCSKPASTYNPECCHVDCQECVIPSAKGDL